MRGFIPMRVHGLADYAAAAMLPAVPRYFGWDEKVTHLFDGAAAAVGGQTALTDFEYGAAKVLPVTMHNAMDVAMGTGLIAAAAMMDDEPDAVRLCVVSVGLYNLVTGLFSQGSPADAGVMRKARNRIGKAVKKIRDVTAQAYEQAKCADRASPLAPNLARLLN